MFTVWSASFLLFTTVFGGGAARSNDDRAMAYKMKQVVQNLDNYMLQHNNDHMELPNIGLVPMDSIELRNGQFGKLSTMRVQDVPYVNQTQMQDGSTAYSFDIILGLDEFQIQYDFKMNTEAYKQEGRFTMWAQQNSMQMAGVAVLRSDKSCEAQITSMRVIHCGDLRIDLQPKGMTHATQISEEMKNMMTPMFVPITNRMMELRFRLTSLQKPFSEGICKVLAM